MGRCIIAITRTSLNHHHRHPMGHYHFLEPFSPYPRNKRRLLDQYSSNIDHRYCFSSTQFMENVACLTTISLPSLLLPTSSPFLRPSSPHLHRNLHNSTATPSRLHSVFLPHLNLHPRHFFHVHLHPRHPPQPPPHPHPFFLPSSNPHHPISLMFVPTPAILTTCSPPSPPPPLHSYIPSSTPPPHTLPLPCSLPHSPFYPLSLTPTSLFPGTRGEQIDRARYCCGYNKHGLIGRRSPFRR